jgi:hypothetical protein
MNWQFNLSKYLPIQNINAGLSSVASTRHGFQTASGLKLVMAPIIAGSKAGSARSSTS